MDPKLRLRDGRSDVKSIRRLVEASKINTIRRIREKSQVQPATSMTTGSTMCTKRSG